MGGIVFVPEYIIVGTGATMIHSPGSLYKNPRVPEPCGERAKAAAENCAAEQACSALVSLNRACMLGLTFII